MTLLVEGLSGFPLAEPLKTYARVFDLDEAPPLGPIDLILVDEPTNKLVMSVPVGCPAICVIRERPGVGTSSSWRLHVGVTDPRPLRLNGGALAD